ncbi:MAG: sigma-54 dependent transcriptional regulator [Bacteroidetes bacterium]|nr:sigma-54 dependent transcriptional regulator [Bacteroidota bacterium]MBU1718794.1 sigma-54 dependent transcriptional regulator [Bacteroidota bacterium]
MEKLNASILLVDDDEDVLLAAKLFLKQHVRKVHTEKAPDKIPALLKAENYDLIFLDMNFTKDATSGKEGFHWMNRILESDPAAVIILMTAYGDIELAVQTIKEGATNFILKPWENKKLLATVMAALQHRKMAVENVSLKSRQKVLSADSDQQYSTLIGSSPPMLRLLAVADKVAATDANVLILGENGTGKELIARYIHRMSPRSSEVFVSVDLGAISESLFESELFGYKKGAFTDAREDKPGRFEVANGGTLFLDEIGNLTVGLQSKLLSVLQSRKVTRLGSNKEVPVDIRLICATNMPLYEMVRENKFRQDLLYRINTVELHLPPLRERKEDLPLLVSHFLETYSKKYKFPLKRLHDSTLKRLEKHSWPGNIRELQHSVERAVILSESNVLQPSDFFLSQSEPSDMELDSYNINDTEKSLIRKVMDKHGGNISKAATELGLTRASLYRRIEKYGI